jgi:hypothetical protein
VHAGAFRLCTHAGFEPILPHVNVNGPPSVFMYNSTVLIDYVGPDNAFLLNGLNSTQALRPAQFPGRNRAKAFTDPADAMCRRASRMYAAHCWTLDQTIWLQDYVRSGVDESQRPAGYFIWSANVTYIRSHIYSECMASKGRVPPPCMRVYVGVDGCQGPV